LPRKIQGDDLVLCGQERHNFAPGEPTLGEPRYKNHDIAARFSADNVMQSDTFNRFETMFEAR